jgi:hypothetical protein
MDSDEEDLVFFGTPIEREEDSISRKKKAIAESSGQLRTLPVWKQEVSVNSFNFFFVQNLCFSFNTQVYIVFFCTIVVTL